MNKFKQKIVFCIVALGLSSGFLEGISRRYLSLRPPFKSGSPEYESFLNKYRCEDERTVFQCVPIFGHTLNPKSIAEYFFPNDKHKLRVATNDGDDEGFLRDLAPDHFNIVTKDGVFDSDVLIKAEHEFFGAGFILRRYIKDWWVEINAPILSVRNKIKFEEKIVEDGSEIKKGKGLDNASFVGSMTEAFNQQNWFYGKIDSNKSLRKTGLGDLELKVGYQSNSLENIFYSGYIGAIFPTGNAPTGEYMFEPVVGNNNHFGLMFGSHWGLGLWCKDDQSLTFGINFNTRYLFKNKQIRSFDLVGKDFSAYIASYKNAKEAEDALNNLLEYSGTSGINLYTKEVRVWPGFAFSAISSILYKNGCFELEAGYNFYAKQAEEIAIDWDEYSAPKDISGNGNTNFARNMQIDFSGASILVKDYSPLRGSDLNPDSAATPHILAYTFYLTLGYNFTRGSVPVFVGIGGSYEIGASTGMSQVAAWGKLEIAF